MYTCTCNTKLNIVKIHQNTSCSIILGNHMSIIWHKSLYYSGFKSKQYICHATGKNLAQQDECMFVYLWKHDPKYPTSRSKGTHAGIEREYREKAYSENIHVHTCTNFYKEIPSCNQYQSKETIIDLRVIKNQLYNSGERKIGDLNIYV